MATKLDRFTSVGCYPLAYLTKTNDVLCAGCATDEANDGHAVTPEVNWENGKLFCDECGTRIESAYAEPD